MLRDTSTLLVPLKSKFVVNGKVTQPAAEITGLARYTVVHPTLSQVGMPLKFAMGVCFRRIVQSPKVCDAVMLVTLSERPEIVVAGPTSAAV